MFQKVGNSAWISFSGSVVIVGEVSEVESALRHVVDKLHALLGFDVPEITRT